MAAKFNESTSLRSPRSALSFMHSALAIANEKICAAVRGKGLKSADRRREGN
jgi:hypothetical protein